MFTKFDELNAKWIQNLIVPPLRLANAWDKDKENQIKLKKES